MAFHVPARLRFVGRQSDAGSDDDVTCTFQDVKAGKEVAVRRLAGVCARPGSAERHLREVKILTRLNHENVQRIVDLLPPPSPTVNDLYVVTERHDVNLQQVIYSDQALSEEHVQFFMSQILCGLQHLHAMNIAHRSLRPAAIMMNQDCSLCISDFYYAAPADDAAREALGDGCLVSGCCHTPPEALLLQSAGAPGDVWAAGCILCELLGRRPAFKGGDNVDQLEAIISVLGNPTEDQLGFLPENAPEHMLLRRLPPSSGWPLGRLLPEASEGALELVGALLQFDPRARPSAIQALNHSYLEAAVMEESVGFEPAPEPFPWASVPKAATRRELENHFYLECAMFREELLARDAGELRESGVEELLKEEREKGWYKPQWRPQLQADWHKISQVVLKSEDPSIRAVSSAMTEWGFRRALLSFLLPEGLPLGPEGTE